MTLSAIMTVVVVVAIGLIIFNLVFESFRYIINIAVVIGLVVWILYARGMITNLPNVNQMYDKVRNSITNAHF
jgi:hypothetical protein